VEWIHKSPTSVWVFFFSTKRKFWFKPKEESPQEENTFWQKIPSRVGNDQLSIHLTRLLDYLKSSDIFCPRKLFWAKIPHPKKALQKISLDFCLKNQSCYRR